MLLVGVELNILVGMAHQKYRCEESSSLYDGCHDTARNELFSRELKHDFLNLPETLPESLAQDVPSHASKKAARLQRKRESLEDSLNRLELDALVKKRHTATAPRPNKVGEHEQVMITRRRQQQVARSKCGTSVSKNVHSPQVDSKDDDPLECQHHGSSEMEGGESGKCD